MEKQPSNHSPRPTSKPGEAFANHYNVIAPLIMGNGVGDGKTTSCVMAQAATIDALRRGETLAAPTDQMECACPLLRRMAIRLNDTAWWKDNEERTALLRPIIPLLLDSKVSQELTWTRIFRSVDFVVRELTPMRLEYIAIRSKSDNCKASIAKGLELLKTVQPISGKSSAKAASVVCKKLKESAYADAYQYADADADAYQYEYAHAHAYAYADAYEYADKCVCEYADEYAYEYADSNKCVCVSKYADAYECAPADAQKRKYRDAYLALFKELAAIK